MQTIHVWFWLAVLSGSAQAVVNRAMLMLGRSQGDKARQPRLRTWRTPGLRLLEYRP
jgi:hypothetical protein